MDQTKCEHCEMLKNAGLECHYHTTKHQLDNLSALCWEMIACYHHDNDVGLDSVIDSISTYLESIEKENDNGF